MEYLGRVKVTGGNVLVPDYYKKAMVCSLVLPRPGVDLTVVTKTHILELCSGVLVRCASLGHPEAEVKEVFCVRGEGSRWVYVLAATNAAIILDGATLGERAKYEGVHATAVGDWLNTGQVIINIQTHFGDPILTDGFSQIDLDQSWPRVEEKNGDNVKDALAARLEVTRGAVAAARGMWEAEKALVEDTARRIVHDWNLADTVGEDELLQVAKGGGLGKLELRRDLHITDQWTRLAREQLVLGLEVQTGTLDISDINVCISGLNLRYNIKVIEDAEDSPIEKKMVKANRNVYVVVTFTMQCIDVCSNVNICGVVTYVIPPQHKLLQSETFTFKLSSRDILSGNLRPKVDTEDYIFNRRSFISLICVGVREKLVVRTIHGSLSGLSHTLHHIGLINCQLADNSGNSVTDPGHSLYCVTDPGHALCCVTDPAHALYSVTDPGHSLCCVTDPAHALHTCCASFRQVNSREVAMELLAPDYAKLCLLVEEITRVLPSDVQILLK